MKEIKEIIEIGKKLDELTYEVYSSFAKRDDFDAELVVMWTRLAEWKKGHLKHWKKISKIFVYKNIMKRKPAELVSIIKQLKNIQAELVEFLRRLRKKKVAQQEAISQTVLNEFCLISDIFIEIFYTYSKTVDDPSSSSIVTDCRQNMNYMANTLRPYLKLNPLFSALRKSMGEIDDTHEFLVLHFGKKKKASA